MAGMEARFARSAGTIAAGAGLLLAFQSIVHPSTIVALAMGVATVVAVTWLNVRNLDIASTFPELLRFGRFPYILRWRQG